MSDEKNQQVAVKAEQVFVVQRQDSVEVVVPRPIRIPEDGGNAVELVETEKRDYWVDIATVTIPANTPRRIALKQALKDAGIPAGDAAPKLRALDVKSAEVHEPEAHQPPMEWRL